MYKSFIKANNLKSLKVLAVTALFSAISIVLGKFLAFNVGDTLRFSFENLPIILSGIFFGPITGALCGAVADIIGCILRGYAINPILTFASVFIGFTAGAVFSILSKANIYLRTAVAVLLCHSIGSVVIKTIGLCLWYGSPIYITLLQRGINYAIVGVAELILLIILLKNKMFTRQISTITRGNNGL